MKGQPLHMIIAACLGGIILLFLFPTSLNKAIAPLPSPFPVSQTPFETGQSRPGGAVASNQPAARQIELPATANQALAPRFDKLIPHSPSVMDESLIDLPNFVAQVSNHQKNEIRGVYVPRLFAFPVIRQPKNNPIFVSNKHDRVTLFQNAARNNVTGLLAHNYLAGSFFQQLAPGHKVLVVYGDGGIRRYRIVSTHHFQKLDPTNVRSLLIDLATGETLTTAQVFNRFYQGEHHLTFQTCLKRQGRLDWGLTFIVATPFDN